MALANIFRKAVKTIDKITKSVQIDVTHFVVTGHDGFGKPTYSLGVARKAVYDETKRTIRQQGQKIPLSGTLIFVSSVAVGPDDEVSLPDGSRWKLISLIGVVDPGTNVPFAGEVGLAVL